MHTHHHHHHHTHTHTSWGGEAYILFLLLPQTMTFAVNYVGEPFNTPLVQNKVGGSRVWVGEGRTPPPPPGGGFRVRVWGEPFNTPQV